MMKINGGTITAYIAENEWVKVGAYALGIIVLLVGTYVLMLIPQSHRLHQLRADIEHMKTKVQQYGGFSGFEARLGQQRDMITALSSSFSTDGNAKQEKILDEIANLCQQSGVNLDRINPTNIDIGQAWSLTFAASFQRVSNFLTAVEKSFKIEGVRIARNDRASANMQAEIIIAPLNAGNSAGGFALEAGKDIFDLYDMTDAELKQVQQKQAEMGIAMQFSRDPFTGESYDKKPEMPKQQPQKRAPVIETPSLPIESIFWDPETPVVIIEGKALREGDSVRDITITKILQDGIIVNWHARSFTLRAARKEMQ